MAYINRNRDTYGWNRSVYDGLMLGFGEKDLLQGYFSNTVPKVTGNMVELLGFLMEKGTCKESTG